MFTRSIRDRRFQVRTISDKAHFSSIDGGRRPSRGRGPVGYPGFRFSATAVSVAENVDLAALKSPTLFCDPGGQMSGAARGFWRAGSSGNLQRFLLVARAHLGSYPARESKFSAARAAAPAVSPQLRASWPRSSRGMQRPWDSLASLLPGRAAAAAASPAPSPPAVPGGDPAAAGAAQARALPPEGTGKASRPLFGVPSSAAVPVGAGWRSGAGGRGEGEGTAGGVGPSTPYSTSSGSSSAATTPSTSPTASAFGASSPSPAKWSRRGFIRETTSSVSAAAMAAVFGSAHVGALSAPAPLEEAPLPRQPPQIRPRRRPRMAYLKRFRSPPQYRDRLNGSKAWSDPEGSYRDFIVPVNNLMDAPAGETAAALAMASASLERKGRRAEATEAYLQASLGKPASPTADRRLEPLVSADVDRKEALEEKLHEYMRAAKMSDDADDADVRQAGVVADTVINLAVKAAICVKQSPIPDLVGSAARYAVQKARQADELFGVQEKAWRVGRMAVNKGIELDREYDVHQKLADVAFVAAAAILKAGFAYSEAKPYRDLKATTTTAAAAAAAYDGYMPPGVAFDAPPSGGPGAGIARAQPREGRS
ncbi:MAG: hypothetical protein BJ554DRAFT_2935 [Olpidium bornovanus]|uniref:Uncharacterized protein n=1 Tax=Olpidium bornovanus TaxID=278681 RepID=A0A8H8DG12_9FUNG|nr:MAG: hypothetical protein BJ554DRAFT_2935 [Olpidium bornovanus]